MDRRYDAAILGVLTGLAFLVAAIVTYPHVQAHNFDRTNDSAAVRH